PPTSRSVHRGTRPESVARSCWLQGRNGRAQPGQTEPVLDGGQHPVVVELTRLLTAGARVRADLDGRDVPTAELAGAPLVEQDEGGDVVAPAVVEQGREVGLEPPVPLADLVLRGGSQIAWRSDLVG